MKKKKLKLLLIISLFLTVNINKIHAYTAEGTGASSGINIEGSDCGDGGCYGGYTAFEVRITLLDKTGARVPGTKVIEFGAMQPAIGEHPSVQKVYDINNVKYAKADSKETATTYLCNFEDTNVNNHLCAGFSSSSSDVYSTKIKLDFNQKQITFLGTSRTKDGMLPENTELNRHYVYMGFGDDRVYTYEGENFPILTKKFVNYIISLDTKNYVEEYGNYVNFIDYFLHASGFSKSWEASKDYEILRKIKEGQYYLLIEPIQHPAVRINGTWYGVEGTANQLAEFQTNNFGTAWDFYTNRDYIRNLFCNFMDTKSVLTTLDEQQILKNCHKETYESFESNSQAYYRTISMLSQANLPYGVTTIDLNQIWKDKITTQECVLDIDTCNDNNFIFETKFYALDSEAKERSNKYDIAECIYGMDDETRKKYYYTTTSSTGQNLYCYDDLTYDFSKLKQLENDDFKSNTYVNFDPGNLNIERTCFSTTKFNDTATLENILIKDNITQKNYENQFDFNFLGKNYTYTRENQPYSTGDYIETVQKDDEGQIIQYIYTSTISYRYNLVEGLNFNNAKIAINNYTINYGLPDKNSILYNKDSSEGQFVYISQTNAKKYINEFNAKINDSYGLSTQMVKMLKNSSSTSIISSETNMNRKGTIYTTSSKVNLHIIKDNNNVCQFDAELKNGQVPAQFRVISLSNPFPARDGTSRIPGKNWLNSNENNVYDYIQNNRNVNADEVYNKEPIYTVTLTPTTMIKIREYNKSHSYNTHDITCENGTGRMCIDNFIRNSYVNVQGTCKTIKAEEITQINRDIKEITRSGCYVYENCPNLDQTKAQKIDTNKDGIIDKEDYLNAEFYECADKTAKSGG